MAESDCRRSRDKIRKRFKFPPLLLSLVFNGASTIERFQDNQRIVFLSDGAANLRQLQSHLTPKAQHILDWFHLTMRFTVLQQYLQGLTKVDADGEQMQKRLESAKWHLWHGNTTNVKSSTVLQMPLAKIASLILP